MSRTAVALERLAIAVCSLALSIGLIVLLSGYFSGRDGAGVGGSTSTETITIPGRTFADQGARHLSPGAARPAYDSDPPTSGPHVDVPVTRDEQPLSVDQLLQALQVGDVVLFYGSARPPAALRALAARLAPPFSPARAASGRAIILAPRGRTTGVIAVAWAHMLRSLSPSSTGLSEFISYWLARRHT